MLDRYEPRDDGPQNARDGGRARAHQHVDGRAAVSRRLIDLSDTLHPTP